MLKINLRRELNYSKKEKKSKETRRISRKTNLFFINYEYENLSLEAAVFKITSISSSSLFRIPIFKYIKIKLIRNLLFGRISYFEGKIKFRIVDPSALAINYV